MNSAPHLLAEDRPEFERVLDQALRSADRDPEISALAAAIGQRLNTEQLRTMAINAMAAISACAMAEYRTYVRARDDLRARSGAVQQQRVGAGRAARGDNGDPAAASTTATAPGDAAEGAGAGAVLAVLAPVLAGIAALLFLVIGYVLRVVASNDSVGDPMITAGWWFAGLTAVGGLIAMTALLLTALRNGHGPEANTPGDRTADEMEHAREAWRQALLERGVLPFLREALANAPAEPGTSYVPGPRTRDHHGRTPHLGYSRPGFSSHDSDNSPHTRPSFTSPDFTSPDFGGPEEQPE